jgi:hypothetical protein
MPVQAIIVQEIIRPLPINISYLQPNNVNLQPHQYYLQKNVTNLEQSNHKIMGTGRF